MKFAKCHPDQKHHAKGLCHNCYHRQWAKAEYLRTNKIQARIKSWRDRNPDKVKQTNKKHKQGIKLEVLNAYGAECVCCGEEEISFLSLDHINNDGHVFRKKNHGGGNRIYSWAKRNSFPATLRVLCHNCNMGRQINGGVCPHQQMEQPG